MDPVAFINRILFWQAGFFFGRGGCALAYSFHDCLYFLFFYFFEAGFLGRQMGFVGLYCFGVVLSMA